MGRYIIACRFGHAFVCRTWVSKTKARPGRRYGIAKNWRCLEAPAIEAVRQRAGAGPVQGVYPCFPDLAAQATFFMGGLTRTKLKRALALAAPVGRAGIAAEEIKTGDVLIFVLSYFGRPRCVLHRAVRWNGNTLESERALNWRELEAPAREAILARYGSIEKVGGMTCPHDLAALAIWPGEHKEKEQ